MLKLFVAQPFVSLGVIRLMVGRIAGAALAGLQVEAARLARSAQNVVGMTASTAAGPVAASARVAGAPGASASAAQSAQLQFAEIGGSNADLAAETVQQITALQSFKANVAVLRTADEMTQSLLRIKA